MRYSCPTPTPGTTDGESYFRIAEFAALYLFALVNSTAVAQDRGEQLQVKATVDEVQASEVEETATSAKDEQRASLLFEQGKTAFARGDYATAAQAFDQAYAASPHHSALWNAALSWERGAEPVKAANRFAGYLDEAPPNARDRDTATSRLQVLSEKLGRLELQAEGLSDLQLDGQPVASTTVYVSPGSHVVVARKGSKTVRRLASVQAGELLSLVLAPGLEGADTDIASDTQKTGDKPKHLLTPLDDRPTVVHAADTSWRGLPPISFYAGTVITTALAGVTVWSGIDTQYAKDHFDRVPSRANLEAGREKQNRTNILFAITLGAALLTGATALWLVDWHGEGSDRKSASTLFRARW